METKVEKLKDKLLRESIKAGFQEAKINGLVKEIQKEIDIEAKMCVWKKDLKAIDEMSQKALLSKLNKNEKRRIEHGRKKIQL